MSKDKIAKSSIVINAPVTAVWDSLTNPEIIKQYMFGTEVVTDWQKGSKIVWKGIWKEKPYEDKGEIIKIVPLKMLKYTHFSPLSGQPDEPKNYHTVTYQLEISGAQTELVLTQDNNETEEDLLHSQQMWDTMLKSLKKLVEK